MSGLGGGGGGQIEDGLEDATKRMVKRRAPRNALASSDAPLGHTLCCASQPCLWI